jgi:arsenate reductase-like glutaredoxin family protein
VTCGRTQEFLAKNRWDTAEQVDARKGKVSANDALALAKDVDEIYSAKGKRVVHVDLRKEKPDAETLRSLLIGPSGNLRAPTLRKGRTLVVGFDEATYRKVFG